MLILISILILILVRVVLSSKKVGLRFPSFQPRNRARIDSLSLFPIFIISFVSPLLLVAVVAAVAEGRQEAVSPEPTRRQDGGGEGRQGRGPRSRWRW